VMITEAMVREMGNMRYVAFNPGPYLLAFGIIKDELFHYTAVMFDYKSVMSKGRDHAMVVRPVVGHVVEALEMQDQMVDTMLRNPPKDKQAQEMSVSDEGKLVPLNPAV